MAEKTHCDICENHCPVDALGCGRGERAYGAASQEAAVNETFGGLAGKLAEVGTAVRIKGDHIRSRAGKDPDVMFEVLSEDERAELEVLLDKLQEGWRAHHATHRGGRGGYRH